MLKYRGMKRVWLGLVLYCMGCASYRAALDRGQRFYEDTEYERALALWRVLEPDVGALNALDRARYVYLRGMTDYRLGFYGEASHWLALAKAQEMLSPGSLSRESLERLEKALSALRQRNVQTDRACRGRG